MYNFQRDVIFGSDLATYTVTLSSGSVLLQAVSAGGQQSAKVQYSVVAV